MALDRLTIITSSGLSTVSDYVIDGLRAVGVVTASTVQVGAATTVHTTGIDLGSGNITSHNINSTGIITATGVTVTGDLTVEGTLAYDDVTNIDSVGLGTFRNGINVTGGEVGIGTDNPYHELHIQGDGDTRALITSGGNSDAVMMFENASGNTWGHGIDLTNNNYVVAYNSLSDPSLTIDGILDITTAGNIGINESSPSRKLHINSGSTDTAMLIESTDADVQINLKDVNSSDGVSIGARGDDFYVRTGLTVERLRIDSNGSALLTTTGQNTQYSYAMKLGQNSYNPNDATGPHYGLWVRQLGPRYQLNYGVYSEVEDDHGFYGGSEIDGLTTVRGVGVYGASTSSSQARQKAIGVYGKAINESYNYNSVIGVRGRVETGTTTFTNNDVEKSFGGHFVATGKSNVIGVYADAYLDGSPGANQEAIPLLVASNGSEKLRVTSDGKIGIGADNPQHLLHLKSTGDATLLIQADSDNNGENDNPRILLAQDGSTNGMLELGLIGDANSPLNNTLANGCYIQANNNVDQPLFLGHMGENVMTIRDGKVGITTHDPQGELHLYSNAPVLAATATNTTSGLRVNVRGQSSASSQLFRVQDNNSTRFTITEGGFMGISNSGSRAPAAPLDVYRETNLTGAAGYVFGTFTHHMGSSGDISQQRSYLDFVFTDNNANFVPQVRIGAQVGWSKGADQGQPSEGHGSFIVFTGKGTAGATDGSGTLTERFRVDEDGIVTMSGQVAFEAIRTTDISGGTNGTNLQNKYVTYESESYDIGGNMNLSTGLFTAPVNGIYLFSFGMAIDGGDGSDDSMGVNFRIANNATYYNFTNSNVSDFRINPRSITRPGQEHTYTFTKQVRMAAGATCGFYITDWNYASTNLQYAEFCGCKVA